MDISPLITEGCDKGKECVVVASLDTEGLVCKDISCNSYKSSSVNNSYVVGDYMYVMVQFKD